MLSLGWPLRGLLCGVVKAPQADVVMSVSLCYQLEACSSCAGEETSSNVSRILCGFLLLAAAVSLSLSDSGSVGSARAIQRVVQGDLSYEVRKSSSDLTTMKEGSLTTFSSMRPVAGEGGSCFGSFYAFDFNSSDLYSGHYLLAAPRPRLGSGHTI